MSDLQNHIKFVESINRRMDSIYKQLCEYEDFIDPRTVEEIGGDSQAKIMDLLDTLQTIQDAAQGIRPYNMVLRTQQQSLQEQMKCLQQCINLMKLETDTVSNKENTENGMQE